MDSRFPVCYGSPILTTPSRIPSTQRSSWRRRTTRRKTRSSSSRWRATTSGGRFGVWRTTTTWQRRPRRTSQSRWNVSTYLFFKLAIPGLFFFLLSFQYSWQMFHSQIYWWLYSNHRPLVSEVTTLLAEPQPNGTYFSTCIGVPRYW